MRVDNTPIPNNILGHRSDPSYRPEEADPQHPDHVEAWPATSVQRRRKRLTGRLARPAPAGIPPNPPPHFPSRLVGSRLRTTSDLPCRTAHDGTLGLAVHTPRPRAATCAVGPLVARPFPPSHFLKSQLHDPPPLFKMPAETPRLLISSYFNNSCRKPNTSSSANF